MRYFIACISFLIGITMASGQGCAEPTSDEGVVVFGFLQPQYDYHFAETPSGESDNYGTFRFNRMRIGVMGNIPYDFQYYALIEASPFINPIDEGQMFLIDAFITYARFDWARISIGQFKKPQGLELLTPCSGLHTIHRSEMVNNLTGPANRDLGVTVMGGNKNTRISYQVAIMNGGSPGQLNSDRFYDYYGRFEFQALPFVRLGGSAVYGKTESTIEDADPDEKFRYGADIDFQLANWRVQSEYMFGEDIGSYTTGGGCDGGVEMHQGSIKRDGFFVMGMYMISDRFQPVIKYEEYNMDKEDPDALHQVTTFGLNVFPNDWTRVQVNYMYRAEDPEEIVNDALSIQLQVKF